MDAESKSELSSVLRTIDETRDRMPFLGQRLATLVKQRIDPETSTWSRAAVGQADAVLALFEPSGELTTDGSATLARKMNALEETVWLLLQGKGPQIDVIALHEKSRFNREALAESSECGCFHCVRIFPPSEIRLWVRSDENDSLKTCAVCPYCSVDAILPRSTVPLTFALLNAMHVHWFSVHRQPPEDADGCPGERGQCSGGF